MLKMIRHDAETGHRNFKKFEGEGIPLISLASRYLLAVIEQETGQAREDGKMTTAILDSTLKRVAMLARSADKCGHDRLTRLKKRFYVHDAYASRWTLGELLHMAKKRGYIEDLTPPIKNGGILVYKYRQPYVPLSESERIPYGEHKSAKAMIKQAKEYNKSHPWNPQKVTEFFKLFALNRGKMKVYWTQNKIREQQRQEAQ